VIPESFPIDYLVFSSGAGIMDYKTREIISSFNLPGEMVRSIALKLRDLGVSFKVLGPVPHNHHYFYYKNGELHPDFIRRMEYYRGFESEISFDPPNFGESCQFLIILPRDPVLFERLKSHFPDVKVIRATSPMDHQSIWMEIYHPDVSKANGVDFISSMYQIDREEIMGIGNDFNDLDLLAHAGQPFLVANAPEEIRNLYPLVRSNNENGFTDAVTSVLPQVFSQKQ
jgi:hydroxymethylpyrimidine pyrophosphatase-like HAD family hydrolase